MSLDFAKSTKDAGLDLIYAIDARLKDLQGAAGSGENWRYLFDKGKLSVLSALGSMEESRDAAYDRRRHALVTTRRLVSAIEKEYSAVVQALGELGDHHAQLCILLSRFRRECDLHITSSADEPPSDGEEDLIGTPTGGGTPVPSSAAGKPSRRSASPSPDSGFVSISSHERDELRSIADDDLMQKFEQRMKGLFAELNETVKGSCLGISKTSIRQMDETYVKTTSAVDRAQTAFDVKRRETAATAKEVEALKAEIAELKSSNRGVAVSNSSSSSSCGSKIAAKTAQLEQKEALLSEQCQMQERLLRLYRGAVHEGMKNLHFGLEQVSMSTWSTYNIFFSQLGSFFSDATVETKRAAKALVELKNAQNVARVISEEKKQRLLKAAAAAPSSVRANQVVPTEELSLAPTVASGSSSSSSPSRVCHPAASGGPPQAIPCLFFVDSDQNSNPVPQRVGGGSNGDELDLLLWERSHAQLPPPAPAPSVGVVGAARGSQSPPDWEELFS
jgi:hypothetical protein